MVARVVRDDEAAGSNPVTPTRDALVVFMTARASQFLAGQKALRKPSDPRSGRNWVLFRSPAPAQG